MSLKLHTRSHPSLQGCFSGMPLIPIPVPIWGVKISQNLRNGYLTRNRRPNGIRESFVSVDLFPLTFNNIFLVHLRGGDRPPPYGSATEIN